jgi:hypothetical protein
VADPLLNDILRRAVFAQAVQGLPTGFAPQPITFAPAAAPAGAPSMAGGMARGMGGGMSDVEVGPGMDAMGGGGGVGFGPIEGMQTFSTPFGPMTIADVIGKGVDLLAPMPLQLGSMMLTGKTMGSQMKGALTPVSTATPISSQAFGLAEQLGVTPAEAQSLIATLGLEGVPVTGPAVSAAPATADIGVTSVGPGDTSAISDVGPDGSIGIGGP